MGTPKPVSQNPTSKRVQKRSAGLMMYRHREGQLEVLLVHPGGPFWVNRDRGAWMIPKGEYMEGEAPLDAAKREFLEETGFVPSGRFIELGTVQQFGGKLVTAWAFAGDCNPDLLVSNTCEIEWPPRSGRKMEIVEVDRGRWFSIPEAHEYILKSQEPFLERIEAVLSSKL